MTLIFHQDNKSNINKAMPMQHIFEAVMCKQTVRPSVKCVMINMND